MTLKVEETVNRSKMSAKKLTSEEWKKMVFIQRRLKPDVLRTTHWIFTQAYTYKVGLVSPTAAAQLAALQNLYRIAPSLFTVSTLHGQDNHFDIRVDYGGGRWETLHVTYFHGTNNVKDVTTRMKKDVVPIWWSI